MQLLNTLEAFSASIEQFCTIEGSPGLGKSTSVCQWAWACSKGLHDGKKILWVHIAKFTDPYCVIFSDKSCKVRRLRVPALIDLLSQPNIADLVILDGYGSKLGENFQECITSLSREHNRKIIIFSSLGGFLKVSDFGLS